MTFAKLYQYSNNPRARVALVVAAYEELELELVPTNPFAPEGLSAEYLAKFPMGLVPALEKDDFLLTESLAIANYLASYNNKAGLILAGKEDAAHVQQWCNWSNIHLLPALGGWFAPLTHRVPYNKSHVEESKAKVHKCAAILEKHLADKTFLVGHRITLADIFVACMLGRGMEFVLDDAFRAAHPNLTRHFNTIVHQAPFTKVLGGEPILIATAIVYVAPKKEPAAPKEPKAPAAPKAPKAKAPKVDDDEEEADPTIAEPPKAKHPCEALGAAKSFPLDEWKRQYSNNELPAAMSWLEEHFDAQEYSLWRVEFKYPEELTKVFMSANLIGGFHSRLEGSRKYLFGSAAVYGVENDSIIAGCYLLRGSSAKDVFDVAPDIDSYSYTPLDLKADRDFIVSSWSWEGGYNGKPFADAKVFK